MDNLEKILESCIEKRRKHGLSVEEILKDIPGKEAEDIRPLLELAEELTLLPDPEPSPGAALKIMAQVVSEQKKNNANKWRLLWTKNILRIAAGFVVIFFLGLGSAYASSNSLPGDFLYPLKRFTEKVRFFLASTDKDKAELRLIFSDKRLAEAVKKHQKGKPIDPALLDDMLNEARKALLYSTKLDIKDKKELVSLLDRTTLRQRDGIENLYKKASPDEQKTLSPFLCACNHRCKMIKRVMTDMGIKSVGTVPKCNVPESSIKCGCKNGEMCPKSQEETNAWKCIYPSK
jgi:hypothetical protein